MEKKAFKVNTFTAGLAVFAAGLLLRLAFWKSGSADTYAFELWFSSVREAGMSAFTDFLGDYNVPYIAVMYFVTKLPFSDFVCVKLVALAFDLLGPTSGYLIAKELASVSGGAGSGSGEASKYGLIGMALVWLSPITIGNAGYQAQLEAMWAFTGFLAVYMFWKKRPAIGMALWAVSFAMKPQGVFFLPFILLYYYRSKSFSILHFLVVPAVIEVLSIPSMIAGNSFLYFWQYFLGQAGRYPFVYYYYPNIWIWMRDLPYYVFGKVGIGMMVTAFVLVTIGFVRRGRDEDWTFVRDLELLVWSLMTCAMFLPAMHERYNYPAEVMLPVLAVFDKKYRVPAAVLVASGWLCNGMSYYGWGKAEFYGLSLLNMAVYACLCAGIVKALSSRGADLAGSKADSCRGSEVKGGSV